VHCSGKRWGFNDPTTSCLVGGYVYNEPVGATFNGADGQANGQTGTSPAPYPFETEVLVAAQGQVHSFQGSVQGPAGPAVVTPMSQSLDMATGELSTVVKFGANDSSWSIELDVLQFVSQSVPSLGLQQITVTKRTAGLNITIVPAITTTGLPGTTVSTDLPENAFKLGPPSVLLMRSNAGVEVAMQVQTTCMGADHADGKGKPLSSPCVSSHGNGSLTMQSFHAVVGDALHPEPAFGAVRQSHYGHYRGCMGQAPRGERKGVAGELALARGHRGSRSNSARSGGTGRSSLLPTQLRAHRKSQRPADRRVLVLGIWRCALAVCGFADRDRCLSAAMQFRGSGSYSAAKQRSHTML